MRSERIERSSDEIVVGCGWSQNHVSFVFVASRHFRLFSFAATDASEWICVMFSWLRRNWIIRSAFWSNVTRVGAINSDLGRPWNFAGSLAFPFKQLNIVCVLPVYIKNATVQMQTNISGILDLQPEFEFSSRHM